MKKIIKCTLQWSRGSTAKKNLHKQTKRGICSEASSEPFFVPGSRWELICNFILKFNIYKI